MVLCHVPWIWVSILFLCWKWLKSFVVCRLVVVRVEFEMEVTEMKMNEAQNVEYKRSWHDEYLKWVCGFANAKGRKI